MKRMHYLNLIALAVLVPALTNAAEAPLSPPGASERIDAIWERGTLRLAVLDEYSWLKQTPGEPTPFVGPAWHLAPAYAQRPGVTIATVPVGFADKLQSSRPTESTSLSRRCW